MGLLIAAVWKKSNKSETGALGSMQMWRGLCKKGVILLIVLIAYRLDLALGTNYIRTAVIIAFIVNEMVSIVENAGIMGIPMPSVIIKAIDVLKKKEE
jgi:toxin secretion/phage lysis holin